MTEPSAVTLEEAALAILKESKLTPEDRETLEKTVRIARLLQKTPEAKP